MVAVMSIDCVCSGFVNTSEKFCELRGERSLQFQWFSRKRVGEFEPGGMKEIASEFEALGLVIAAGGLGRRL